MLLPEHSVSTETRVTAGPQHGGALRAAGAFQTDQCISCRREFPWDRVAVLRAGDSTAGLATSCGLCTLQLPLLLLCHVVTLPGDFAGHQQTCFFLHTNQLQAFCYSNTEPPGASTSPVSPSQPLPRVTLGHLFTRSVNSSRKSTTPVAVTLLPSVM